MFSVQKTIEKSQQAIRNRMAIIAEQSKTSESLKTPQQKVESNKNIEAAAAIEEPEKITLFTPNLDRQKNEQAQKSTQLLSQRIVTKMPQQPPPPVPTPASAQKPVQQAIRPTPNLNLRAIVAHIDEKFGKAHQSTRDSTYLKFYHDQSKKTELSPSSYLHNVDDDIFMDQMPSEQGNVVGAGGQMRNFKVFGLNFLKNYVEKHPSKFSSVEALINKLKQQIYDVKILRGYRFYLSLVNFIRSAKRLQSICFEMSIDAYHSKTEVYAYEQNSRFRDDVSLIIDSTMNPSMYSIYFADAPEFQSFLFDWWSRGVFSAMMIQNSMDFNIAEEETVRRLMQSISEMMTFYNNNQHMIFRGGAESTFSHESIMLIYCTALNTELKSSTLYMKLMIEQVISNGVDENSLKIIKRRVDENMKSLVYFSVEILMMIVHDIYQCLEDEKTKYDANDGSGNDDFETMMSLMKLQIENFPSLLTSSTTRIGSDVKMYALTLVSTVLGNIRTARYMTKFEDTIMETTKTKTPATTTSSPKRFRKAHMEEKWSSPNAYFQCHEFMNFVNEFLDIPNLDKAPRIKKLVNKTVYNQISQFMQSLSYHFDHETTTTTRGRSNTSSSNKTIIDCTNLLRSFILASSSENEVNNRCKQQLPSSLSSSMTTMCQPNNYCKLSVTSTPSLTQFFYCSPLHKLAIIQMFEVNLNVCMNLINQVECEIEHFKVDLLCGDKDKVHSKELQMYELKFLAWKKELFDMMLWDILGFQKFNIYAQDRGLDFHLQWINIMLNQCISEKYIIQKRIRLANNLENPIVPFTELEIEKFKNDTSRIHAKCFATGFASRFLRADAIKCLNNYIQHIKFLVLNENNYENLLQTYVARVSARVTEYQIDKMKSLYKKIQKHRKQQKQEMIGDDNDDNDIEMTNSEHDQGEIADFLYAAENHEIRKSIFTEEDEMVMLRWNHQVVLNPMVKFRDAKRLIGTCISTVKHQLSENSAIFSTFSTSNQTDPALLEYAELKVSLSYMLCIYYLLVLDHYIEIGKLNNFQKPSIWNGLTKWKATIANDNSLSLSSAVAVAATQQQQPLPDDMLDHNFDLVCEAKEHMISAGMAINNYMRSRILSSGMKARLIQKIELAKKREMKFCEIQTTLRLLFWSQIKKIE